MLVEIPQTPLDKASRMTGEVFDNEAILPISVVRQHTKLEDVPGVSDFMLGVYRDAALEAGQEYTGLFLLSQRVITENVKLPGTMPFSRTMFFNHETKYTFATPLAYYYGLPGVAPIQLQASVGTQKIEIPFVRDKILVNCCNPCGDDSQSPKLQYTAGLSCAEDVPARLILGALKYIAHVVENPGDIIVATNEIGNAATGRIGIVEASNPALASGAVEIWRSLKSDAI